MSEFVCCKCNERIIETLYLNNLPPAHVHWQPNNIRLGWSGDLKREKRAHGGGGRLWGLGCATAKLKIESERIGGQRSNYDVK